MARCKNEQAVAAEAALVAKEDALAAEEDVPAGQPEPPTPKPPDKRRRRLTWKEPAKRRKFSKKPSVAN